MTVPIIALYGSLNALLNILLALRVSGMRAKERVSIGLGESAPLELAARIHGNNAEFVPLALVMLLIAELQGLSSTVLHALGGSLLVARVFHVIGMPRPAPNFFRFTGTAVTWTLIAGISVWILVARFR
jgi:uncharacterized protein